MGGVLILEEDKEFGELLAWYLSRKGVSASWLSPLDCDRWRLSEEVNVVVLSDSGYRQCSGSLLAELKQRNPFLQVILIFDMERSSAIRKLNDPHIFGYFEKPFLAYRDMFLLTIRNADTYALLQSRLGLRPADSALSPPLT